MSRQDPTCHPDRLHRARGLCKPCYDRAHRAGAFADPWAIFRYSPPGRRPMIDLDLGRACQYGYRIWQARTFHAVERGR